MSRSDFDKRMKEYEQVYTSQKIIPHMPIILRIDGHNFHNFTKGCVRPFDFKLSEAFQASTLGLNDFFGKADLAYGQSDEVSILIFNPDTITEEIYSGKTFKMCSLASSIFTAYFNQYYSSEKMATFDCRVFQLPINEVANYFIWRQNDATRNSIQMVGQSNFSQKELHGKSCNKIQDMLMTIGTNWNDFPVRFKRGWCLKNSYIDNVIPIFTKDRDYIENIILTKIRESE